MDKSPFVALARNSRLFKLCLKICSLRLRNRWLRRSRLFSPNPLWMVKNHLTSFEAFQPK